ncbi:hypothetical protein [Brevundimonas sp. TWP1-2-1b1]|uniref:hypothetical protein n=1 Tax=unclassified Brevundimonas TaxID=2622653 RepID=UPI003CF56D91
MPETNLINNWLFAAMTEADQDALRPGLVRQALTQGDVLFRAGALIVYTANRAIEDKTAWNVLRGASLAFRGIGPTH